jgi:hypothetical protein
MALKHSRSEPWSTCPVSAWCVQDPPRWVRLDLGVFFTQEDRSAPQVALGGRRFEKSVSDPDLPDLLTPIFTPVFRFSSDPNFPQTVRKEVRIRLGAVIDTFPTIDRFPHKRAVADSIRAAAVPRIDPLIANHQTYSRSRKPPFANKRSLVF